MSTAALRWTSLGALVGGLAILVFDSRVALAWPPNSAERGPADAQQENLAHLAATQTAFREVAQRLKPSLVRIETVGGAQPVAQRDEPVVTILGEGETPPPKRAQNPFRDTPGGDFLLADGPTTGIVYSEDGYILTSSFNFAREPALVSVILADGRRLAADLVARDQVRKLAMLKVEASGLTVPRWADTDAIRVGQWAVVLGLGFGGSEPSISVGIISALNRMSGNAIQTDVKINPGNYGGPLCDIHGRIVGIAVPLAQRPGELAGIEMYDSGVGFALPKSRVDAIAPALREGKSFYRGWLGMTVDPGAKDSLVVLNLADPSPMRAAGVKPGDKIVQIEGKDVKHFGELVQATYMIPAGEEVYVTLERKDIQFGIRVTLARNTELGPLPEVEEPLDPAEPAVPPPDEPAPTPEEDE